MNSAGATREILWNVPFPWLMYVLLVPTVAIAGYGFYRRIRLWRLGQPEPLRAGASILRDRPWQRLGLVLRHGVAQGRTLRERYAGFFHLLIVIGFLVLTAATTVVMLDHDFGTEIMRGGFYLWFQSLTVDLFGGLVMVGVAMAAVRRWLAKPRQLIYSDEASRILIAIFVIAATGFLIEGWRIAVTDDPWGRWSPIGYAVAVASEAVVGDEILRPAHAVAWWTHCVITFAFLAWAPYTKLAHVVTAPLNIFCANLDGHAASLRPIDFEADDETLGVNDLTRLSWKALLDLDACTECGRCTAACPANAAGKSLSPRDVVLDLRTLLHSESDRLREAAQAPPTEDDEPLIPIIRPDNALAPESLWQCTTCAACVEACPVYIEQLPKILDARRYLVMEEAEMPDTMAAATMSLEKRGHPYPGTQLSRLDWTEGLDGVEVPVLSQLDDPGEVDVLLWVGCANSLVERNHRIVRSLARLLDQAGVRFAILGREERCTGDPARRMGNEFLFENLARKNAGVLARCGVTDGGKKVVTSCPHCFNSLRNDYPALGADLDVEHHTTFLNRLVDEGRLRPAASAGGHDVTFHDPCYLGRYNRVFDEPRELVRASTGGASVEMSASREGSFCCGGGGGMSFAEEPPDQRVNRVRARQALDTGAGVVAAACPFCTTMLEDGLAAVKDEQHDAVAVKDIAELLWDASKADASKA